MRKIATFCFLLICIVISLAQNEIVCISGNKHFNECLKAAISENFHKLHNPNKDAPFDTFDPFWFQYGQIIFNGTDKVHGYFSLQNITLVGGNQMTFEKIIAKTKDKIMKISGLMHAPIIKYDGFYESNLKIEDFAVTSKGSMNGTFEDVNGKFTAVGNLIDSNDGLRQLNVTSFDVILVIKNMKFKINGLSKDEILNSFINRIVNDSWQFLYQDLVQASKSLWESVVIDLFNELFNFVKIQN